MHRVSYYFSPELSTKLKLAAIEFAGLQNTAHSPELWQEIDEYCRQTRMLFAEASEASSLFEASRRMYHSIGLDPTKVRPSSEALLRRAIQQKPLYQVNTLVDVANYCSLDFQLSIGLYDPARLRGQVAFRLGHPGEGYPGINKGWINVAGRLALADDLGPFGNPSSDSDRTKITLGTTSALFVLFAPADFDVIKLQSVATKAVERIIKYCDGKAERIIYFPSN